jgi:hypothetical protein
MRPEDPRTHFLARVVLIFGALASAPVSQGWTVDDPGFSPSIGRQRRMAFRGAFSRFEGV